MYQDAKIAASRLFEIMDLEVEDITDKVRFSAGQIGDIVFENISFRYGTQTNVFEHFNATFKKWNVSAIVGESGSGKTTLAALMQNLYPLLEGHIRIGGMDIRHIDNSDLRSLVCVVPQKIDLFNGTILENIVLDDYSPDINKVLNICRALSDVEMSSVNGGYEITKKIIELLSYMFYSEAKGLMDAEAVGGVVNVIAFK